MKAFSLGLLGRINCRLTPVCFEQSNIAIDVNLIPLSQTILNGLSCQAISLSSSRATCKPLMDVSTMLVDEIRTDWRVSIRRACSLIRFDPRTYRYKFRRRDQAAMEQRIEDICQTRVRFGYRRLQVLLRREGWEINAKKTYRIYKELGMQLRNKPPKRRVKAELREDRKDAAAPSYVWAMDFVHDQLPQGGRSVFKRSRISSLVMFQCLMPRLATKAKMWSQRWIRCVARSAIPRRSELTTAANLSPATWICGLISGTSLWTSHGPEDLLTTLT